MYFLPQISSYYSWPYTALITWGKQPGPDATSHTLQAACLSIKSVTTRK